MTIKKLMIRPREAAEFLGVSPRTLEGLRQRGGGPPFVKVGNAVRYSTTELASWIEANTFQNTSEVRS